MSSAPPHYRKTIRRLIRFSMAGIAAGLLLGIVWTELRKRARYGPTPAVVTPAEREAGARADVNLPPGLYFEAGLDLKLGHGHVILVAGLLPLGLALSLHLLHAYGGGELKEGALDLFFWTYALGAAGALALMVYKGYAGYAAVRAGEFDLRVIDAGLFGGKRWLRGACYGISHTLLAIGTFGFVWQIFRAAGRIEAGQAA